MPEQADKGSLVAEHVLEVRYAASGGFLDVRGYIAEFVRKAKLFDHWKIDSNVVNFRDAPDGTKDEAAFIGYKSSGYVSLNPPTKDFFPDRASAFWKTILKNEHFAIPEITRFGSRTKIFVPSSKNFADINKHLYETVFTKDARALFGGVETDLQFTIELKDKGFDGRIIVGPLHSNEASSHFQFDTKEFAKCGLYMDVDFFSTDNISDSKVPDLLRSAVDLTWHKAEMITSGVGL